MGVGYAARRAQHGRPSTPNDSPAGGSVIAAFVRVALAGATSSRRDSCTREQATRVHTAKLAHLLSSQLVWWRRRRRRLCRELEWSTQRAARAYRHPAATHPAIDGGTALFDRRWLRSARAADPTCAATCSTCRLGSSSLGSTAPCALQHQLRTNRRSPLRSRQPRPSTVRAHECLR